MEPMMSLMRVEVMHCVKKVKVQTITSTMTSKTAAMNFAVPG
jgi:hypothetical protein